MAAKMAAFLAVGASAYGRGDCAPPQLLLLAMFCRANEPISDVVPYSPA